MGFRMRRSIKVAPGIRLNISKTGVGASVGGKYGRYSAHSSGRRTVSAGTGIPGVYYQKGVGSGRKRQAAAPVSAARPLKPGIFAPKGEKQLHKAVALQSVSAIRQVGDEHPNFRLASYSLAGLMLLDDDPAHAKTLLQWVFDTGQEPAADPFVSKYLATYVELPIADGISAELTVGRDAVGLALAELHQKDENLEAAIDVVEQLEPTSYAAVSLAELYLRSARLEDVVQLTEGLVNEDDATALLVVYRACALRDQGFSDAAHESFKEALRSRSRAAPIRHLALSERATNYIAQGKRAQARKDLERILAEDSRYEGVRERLAELT
jgi:tetratricopeptide (TPR) repeat protein